MFLFLLVPKRLNLWRFLKLKSQKIHQSYLLSTVQPMTLERIQLKQHLWPIAARRYRYWKTLVHWILQKLEDPLGQPADPTADNRALSLLLQKETLEEKAANGTLRNKIKTITCLVKKVKWKVCIVREIRSLDRRERRQQLRNQENWLRCL